MERVLEKFIDCENCALNAPFNQKQFADALGINHVHANGTLRKMVKKNLMTWQDRTIIIRDREGLERLSHYQRDEDGNRMII